MGLGSERKYATRMHGLLGLPRSLGALRYHNYRLIWTAQFARGTAQWLHIVGTPLLALELGGSAIDLGIVSALQFCPVLLFAPLGGVLADRLDRSRTLVRLQTAFALEAFAASLLIYSGFVRLEHVYVLSTVFGLINAAEMPFRQSLLGESVPSPSLPSAIVLQQGAYDLTRVIGPATAGLAVTSAGLAVPFAFAGAGAIVTAILLSRYQPERSFGTRAGRRKGNVREDLGAAVDVIRGEQQTLRALLLLACLTAFGFSFQTLLPLYAVDNLGLDRASYGMLLTAFGIGAVVASIPLGSLAGGHTARLIALAATLLSATLLSLVFQSSPILASFSLLFAGMAFVAVLFAVQLTLHLFVPDGLRGRVMGVYLATFHGGMGLGGLLVGIMVGVWGVPKTLLAWSAVTGICALVAVRWNIKRAAGSTAGFASRAAGPQD